MLREQLSEIHSGVNERFRYVSDQEFWHEPEHWERYDEIPDDGVIEGDCDCFALACRKECRKQEIPSRLVFCQVETGGYHLVLECDGWILDNRQRGVVRRDDLDYKWIKISGFERGDEWRLVNKEEE